MKDCARFAGYATKFALLALTFSTAAASAAITPQQAACKPSEQQDRALVAAGRWVDPSLHTAMLDAVFYSANRNSCLASVFFTKRHTTYGGIFDIAEGRMLWMKSYKGTNFSPAHIVAMDEDMDQEIEALEFPSPADNHPTDVLAFFFDHTMNTFPEIRNALTDPR